MANQITINIGAAANDGTGDPLRTAFNDVNLNFANVWSTGLPISNIQFSDNRILTVNTNANLVLAPNGIGVIQANVDILPSVNRGQNLGSVTKKWNTLNAYYINADTANIASFGNLTVPVANLHILGGTNGYVLQTDGTGNLTWTAQTGGGGNGVPGGANTQVQFNDAGVFGGAAGFTFNKSSNVLAVPGNIIADGIYGGQGGTLGQVAFPLSSNAALDIVNNTGNINLITNATSTNQWQFDTTGTLTFPDNSGSGWPIQQQRYGMGNIGAWLDGQWTIGEFSGNGVSGQVGIRIDPAIEGNTGITIPSQVDSVTHPVSIYNTGGGGIELYTGANNWTFDSAGNLNIPGPLVGPADNQLALFSNTDIRLQAKNRNTGEPFNGGRLFLLGGQGSTGNADQGPTGGGYTRLYSGSGGAASAGNTYGAGSGGYMRVRAGGGGDASDVGPAGSGGYLQLNAGSAGYNNGNVDLGNQGGDVNINAGYSTGNNLSGGSISVNTGGTEYGLPGSFQINIPAGANVPGVGTTPGGIWTFDTNGVLTTPLGASGASQQIKYGTGNLVSYLDSGWTLGEYNGASFGTEGMRINPGIEGSVDINLPADSAANTQPLAISNFNTGNVTIRSYNSTWKFDHTGALNLPTTGEDSRIQTSNTYPTVLAYGSGGHGGPELDWMNANDPANTFGNVNTLRHTMYLNGGGLFVGLNENGTANNVVGNLRFDTNANLTVTGNIITDGSGGDIIMSNGNIVGANNIVLANSITTTGSAGNITMTGGSINGVNTISLSSVVGNVTRPGYITWVANSSGDGYNFTTAHLMPDQGVGGDAYLIIDPTYPNHLHLRGGGTQDNSGVQLFLGGENSYFSVAAGSNPQLYATANSHQWQFGTDGNLTVPESIHGTNNGTPLVIDGAGSGYSYISIPTFQDGGEELVIRNSFGGSQGLRFQTESGNFTMIGNTFTGATANVELVAGSYTWTMDNTGTTTFPNGAKLNNSTSLQFATDNTVVTSLDLRDTGGAGFYTSGSGYTLRSNGTYNWIFGTDGNLSAPGLISTVGNVVAIGAVNTPNVVVTKSFVFDGLSGNATIDSSANISTTGNITGNYIFGNIAFATGGGGGSSYGDSNVVTLLAGFGSNSISTTGNITSLKEILLNGDDATGSANKAQMQFGFNGTNQYSQWIATRHNNSNVNNAILFYTSDGTQNGTFPSNAKLGLTVNNQQVGIGNVPTPGNTLDVGGNAYATGNITGGNILTGGQVSVAGNITGGNISVGRITATANITTTGYFISGNQATGGFQLGNVNSRITAGGSNSYATFGQNISFYPDTSASALAGVLIGGSGYLLAPNGSRVLTLGSSGDVAVNGNINQTLANTQYINTVGQISATGNITGGNIKTAGIVSATANITGGNVLTGGLISATGNVTGGNLILSSTGQITSPSGSNGNVTINPDGTGLFVVTSITPAVFGNTLSVTGNVTVSGAGGVSIPNLPAFRVYGNGTTSVSTTTNTTGVLNGNNWAADYNQGSYLNSTTGTFTAPVAGLYQVNLNMRVANNTAGTAQAIVVKNRATANTVQVMWESANNCTVNHFGVSTTSKLAVGDTLNLAVTVGALTFDANDSWSVAFLG